MVRLQPITRRSPSVLRVLALLALIASALFVAPSGAGAATARSRGVSAEAVALCTAYESVVIQAAGDSLDLQPWLAALDSVEQGLDDIGPSPAGLYVTIDRLREATETPIMLDGAIFVGLGYLNGVCNIVRDPGTIQTPTTPMPTTPMPPNPDTSPAQTPDEPSAPTPAPADPVPAPTTVPAPTPTTAPTTVPAPTPTTVPSPDIDAIPAPEPVVVPSPDGEQLVLCSAYNAVLLLASGSPDSLEVDPVSWATALDQLEAVLDNIGPSPAGLYETIDQLRSASPATPITIDGEVFEGMDYLDAICFPSDDAPASPPSSFISVDEILSDGSTIGDVYVISSVCTAIPVIGAQDTIVTAFLPETDVPPINMTLSFDEGFRGASIIGIGGILFTATDPATDFPEDFFLADGAASGDGTLFRDDGSSANVSFSFAPDIACDESTLPFNPPTDPGSYLSGDTGGPLFATCVNLAPTGQYTIRSDVDGTLAPGGPEVGNYLVLHPVGGDRSYLVVGYDANDQARVFISPDELSVSTTTPFYLSLKGSVRTFSAFGDTTANSFTMDVLLSSMGRCNDLTDISDDDAPAAGHVLMAGFSDFEAPEFDGVWEVFFACVDESEEGPGYLYELVLDTNPNDETDDVPGADEFRTASVSMLEQNGEIALSLLSGDSFLAGNVALDIFLETDEVLVGSVQAPSVVMAFWVPIVGPRCT